MRFLNLYLTRKKMFGHPDDRKMEDLSVWLSLVFSPNTTQLDLIFMDSKVMEVQYLIPSILTGP
jgi:hypothetical protein